MFMLIPKQQQQQQKKLGYNQTLWPYSTFDGLILRAVYWTKDGFVQFVIVLASNQAKDVIHSKDKPGI